MNNRQRPNLWKRTYLINPSLQWKMTLKALFWAGLVVTLFYQWEQMLLESVLQEAALLAADGEEGAAFSERVRARFDLFFLTKMLFIFLAILLWGLFWTNRLAGPLYRIKRVLNDCLSGKRSAELRTRRGDYFTDMNDTINKVIKHFNQINTKHNSDD